MHRWKKALLEVEEVRNERHWESGMFNTFCICPSPYADGDRNSRKTRVPCTLPMTIPTLHSS